MWHNGAPGQFPPRPGAPDPTAFPVEPSAAISFNLVLPITRLGVGVFSFDPLEKALGCSVEYLLQPALTGPVYQRPSMAGPAVNVYPLAIPPGEGLSMRLGQWGELGFFNDNALLRLTFPLSAAEWVRQRLGQAIVRGPERGLSTDQSAAVAVVWIRLVPGMRAAVPVPLIGEIGVDVSG